jgi:hypothetical protein
MSRLREGIVTRNLHHEPRGTVHYNIHFKSGNLENGVTERALCGLGPVDIAWVWIVEARRRAAPDENPNFSKLVHERSASSRSAICPAESTGRRVFRER